jgi:hypothetical protein
MNDKGVVPPRRPRRRFGFIAITVVTAIFAAIVASAVAAGALTEASRKAAAPDSSNARPGEPMATAAPAAAHGVADNGTEFNGTFVLRNFREHRGVLEAVGRLTGTLGGQAVNQRVVLPVMGAATEAPAGVLGNGIRQQPVPTPGACDILTLALGPLDLDLLGLRVALDTVNLLIEAIPGAGNLLGNLLCGVAGLLDGVLGGGLGGLVQNLLDAIADLLNGILNI